MNGSASNERRGELEWVQIATAEKYAKKGKEITIDAPQNAIWSSRDPVTPEQSKNIKANIAALKALEEQNNAAPEQQKSSVLSNIFGFRKGREAQAEKTEEYTHSLRR